MKIEILNIEEMRKFTELLAPNLKCGDVICLVGDLGAGKTTFVQFIGSTLGVEESITSPTFNIVHSYKGHIDINHMDFYRLEMAEEVEALDIDQFFYPTGISFIEWSERVKEYLPRNYIEISIDSLDSQRREITIREENVRERELVKRIYENIRD